MQTTKLDLNVDLHAHGLSVIEHPSDPGSLLIGMVNHRKTGSVIELFSYAIDTSQIQHMETVQDSRLVHPNSLQLVAGENSPIGSFYVTNDRKHTSGLMKKVEMYLRFRSGQVFYR